jgi:hypothetical protein
MTVYYRPNARAIFFCGDQSVYLYFQVSMDCDAARDWILLISYHHIVHIEYFLLHLFFLSFIFAHYLPQETLRFIPANEFRSRDNMPKVFWDNFFLEYSLLLGRSIKFIIDCENTGTLHVSDNFGKLCVLRMGLFFSSSVFSGVIHCIMSLSNLEISVREWIFSRAHPKFNVTL